MKMTVVTEKGKVIGVVYGHRPEPSAHDFREASEPGLRAGLMAGPGQEIHVIDSSDRLLSINSPNELMAEVAAELKKLR